MERSKRSFLLAIALGLLGCPVLAGTYQSFSSLCDSIGFSIEEPGSFFFVHVTDTHLGGRSEDNRAENFRAFINEIKQLQPGPAFVVLTGDAVDSGQRREYEVLKELVDELERYVPVHICLGNHDIGWGYPANGAEIFLEIFHGRKLYDSFKKDGIQFAWLHPYPSFEVYPVFAYWTEAGSVVPLDMGEEQERWLEGIVSSDTGTLILFFHQPPGDVFGDEMLFGLMRALSKVPPGRKVWIICGHGHSNSNWRQDLIPYGYVKCVMTASLAYEQCYRIFFVKNGDICSIALKRLGKDFSDVRLSGWQTRQSLFGNSRLPLLFVDIPFDDTYVFDPGDSVKTGSFRSIKDSGITYKIPLIEGAEYFGFCVTGEYSVEISDGETWVKVASAGRKPEYQLTKIVRIPENISAGRILYIRFSDSVEGDRFGCTIAWFGLFGRKVNN